jgi:hypothetical protein
MKNGEMRPQHVSSFVHLLNSLLRHCLKVWRTLTKVTNCCLNLLNTSQQKITTPRCPFGTAVEVPKSVPSSVMSRVTKNPSLTKGRTFRECEGMRSYCCYRDELVWLSCRHNCSLLTQPSRAIKLWMANYSYSLWSSVVTTKSCVIT